MRKKIFTFLLALAASVGMSYALTPLAGDDWDSSTGTLTVNSSPDVWAYTNMEEIQHLVFSDAVTSIGGFAFFGCTALTSITIGNNVESIGARAFMHCSALTSITIPASVTSIGDGVFSNCSALQSIYIEAATPPTLGEAVFDGTAAALKIYVPAESVDDYKTAWSTYEAKIEAIAGGEPEPAGQEITPNVDPQDASVYYSTFYDSNFKYELPTGVEAYVADLSGANLLLTKIADAGQTIPADNAVILKSTVTPFTLTVSDAEAVTFTATNDLQGSDTQIATPANCYVLAGNDGVGFYHYTASMLNPHKAYVIYSGSNQAPKRMPFVFEQATGVENVQGDNVQSTKVLENGVLYIIKNGVKYNAQGQVVK